MPERKNAAKKEKKPEKRFTIVCDDALFSQFQTLCYVAETTPSEFINNYIERVVNDNAALIKSHSEIKSKVKI